MAARATPASDQSRCAELPTNRSGGMPYSSLARGLASRMTPLRGSMTMSASVTLSNRSRYPRSTLRNSSSAGFCSMTRPRSAQARAMPARSVSSGGSEAPEKNSTAASVRRCATAGKANTAAAPSSGSGRHCGAPSRSTWPASPSPPPLGDAPQSGEPLRPLEVPDDVGGHLAGLLGELDAPGLPAGGRADALERRPQRILETAGALRGLPHRAQELGLARSRHGSS